MTERMNFSIRHNSSSLSFAHIFLLLLALSLYTDDTSGMQFVFGFQSLGGLSATHIHRKTIHSSMFTYKETVRHHVNDSYADENMIKKTEGSIHSLCVPTVMSSFILHLFTLFIMSTTAVAQETIQETYFSTSPIQPRPPASTVLLAQSDIKTLHDHRAESMNHQSSVLDWNEIPMSLPTDDHPRIQINPELSKGTDSKDNRLKDMTTNVPLVQGLIYILDHRDWFEEYHQDPSQILILTVSTVSSDQVIAGAKIPLRDISHFPVQVTLGNANIRPTLSSKDLEQLKSSDFKISACTCTMETVENWMGNHGDKLIIPCQDSKSVSFQAMGLAKVLSGDAFGLGSENIIRAPFSLALSAGDSQPR